MPSSQARRKAPRCGGSGLRSSARTRAVLAGIVAEKARLEQEMDAVATAHLQQWVHHRLSELSDGRHIFVVAHQQVK
jgi:hypothetical protein